MGSGCIYIFFYHDIDNGKRPSLVMGVCIHCVHVYIHMYTDIHTDIRRVGRDRGKRREGKGREEKRERERDRETGRERAREREGASAGGGRERTLNGTPKGAAKKKENSGSWFSPASDF